MFITQRTEHTLEIFGPRKQAWRPASGAHFELLREAIIIAGRDRPQEAIEKAQDIWIAAHGHMHGIGFRVHSACTTLSGMSMRDIVDQLNRQED